MWQMPELSDALMADLKRDVNALTERLAAHLVGDGAETYATAATDAAEPLSLDAWRKLTANLPPVLPPIRLIEVDPYPIYGPARRHRKRRIQKKWLKRYGTSIVGYEYPMKDNVLIDERRGIGYCHPRVARAIRARTIPPGV